MNWSEELKRVLKKYWWIFLFLMFGIPLIINMLFKWHSGISFLEGEWQPDAALGFYGAVLGGSIGGLGTLAAVMITTSETREIQKKNEEQLEADRAEKRINDRRLFMNSVIEDVSKLLANLSYCKDCRLKILDCEQKIEGLEKELAQVRINLTKSRKIAGAPLMSNNVSVLEMQEKELAQAIQVERDNAKIYYGSKAPSIERASVLNIKLSGIQGAETLLLNIRHIMELEVNDSVSFQDFVKEMNKTIQITADFADAYING